MEPKGTYNRTVASQNDRPLAVLDQRNNGSGESTVFFKQHIDLLKQNYGLVQLSSGLFLFLFLCQHTNKFFSRCVPYRFFPARAIRLCALEFARFPAVRSFHQAGCSLKPADLSHKKFEN